ncbi:MAG TPA: cytochrome b N-terminal domain-containing protein [Chloroflexia bacterium]|nr:cytochrome b N-terminal domain-containing protein [Chloroflexia bacterium]
MANRVYEWVDERTGIKPALDYVMYRRMPKSVNWLFTLGSASLTVFIIQAVSGWFLAMGYTPSTATVTMPDGSISNEALQSLRHTTGDSLANFGYWVRGFHHWGANLMVIVVLLHMLRVFFTGSYKYPRELTWFTGVFILLMVLGFSFTGYLLPWDNRAYWATQVGVKIGGSAPILGDAVANILRGGPTLGAATLTRFFALHVLLLPALIAGLIAVHMFLIIKIGISGMPKSASKEQFSGEFFESTSLNSKKAGKAFFPYTIFKDAVVSLLVVGLILLATILLPVDSSNPVDTNNPVSTLQNNDGTPIMQNGQVVQIQPQPEWYFLFLFQFLKLFPSEFNFGLFSVSGEAVGGIIVPTIIILVLLLLPYLDRGPKRNPLNRPITTLSAIVILIGMVALTLFAINDLNKAQAAGAPASAAAASPPAAGGGTTPAATTAAAAGGSATTAAAGGATGAGDPAAGLKVFQSNGCAACHPNGGRAAGVGPKLAGTTRDDAYITGNIRNGRGQMPAFSADQVSDQDITNVIAYIRSLK